MPNDSSAEQPIVECLHASVENDEPITLILGSGMGTDTAPRIVDILHLADQYAIGRSDGGDLSRALAQARRKADATSPIAIYAAYREVLTAWSGDEFDVIAQQAVLNMYRPPDRMDTPLATHGIWQRVARDLGEWLENDLGSWQLTGAVEALGATLARLAGEFGNQIVTTNFDPLLEIAIRSANGRAVSVPLDPDGTYGVTAGEDGAIRVYHVHGFWRPVLDAHAGRLIHDPASVTGAAVGPIAELVTGDTICVLGTSDWAGTIVAALAEVAGQRPIRVLWALHSDDKDAAARWRDQLAAEIAGQVDCYPGVDSGRLFELLARRLNVTVIPRAAGPRHRVRHPIWEQEFVSHPDSAAPADTRLLLNQLERRFGWKVLAASAGTPTLIFWPVRLRHQASVIHMVQALAAGALASRGAGLVISLDDLGIWQPETVRVPFEADLKRWIRHTGPDVEITFASLSEFIEQQRTRSPDLLRPTDPWSVARDFYGEHNPSLYSVLAAIKVVPNVALQDMEENAWQIVQALLRMNANRLLTPMTMWSFLHDLLRDHPTSSVMTLGGRDEGLFWELWRQVYGLGISQLYNPYIKSLTHKSGMLRWSTVDELRANLGQLRELPGWDQDGAFIPWLFQNTMLLPIYLTRQPAPEAGGFVLDSWAAFLAAMDAGVTVLDVLAEFVTDLYRGTTSG